jgi:hypothetical protein
MSKNFRKYPDLMVSLRESDAILITQIPALLSEKENSPLYINIF